MAVPSCKTDMPIRMYCCSYGMLSYGLLYWYWVSNNISLSTVVLSIGMGPMPAIVDLWGYNVQSCSCSSSSSCSM